MNRKIAIGMIVAAFIFVSFGVASATTDWNDDNVFNGTVNWFKNGIRIGQQGSGGVTFFNGTIINETTDADENDNPVAFGDNVRIDGELWRGETSGPGDDMPVKINDDLRLYGSVEGLDVADVTGLQDDLDAKLDLAGGDITGNLTVAGTSLFAGTSTFTGDLAQGVAGRGVAKSAFLYNPANTITNSFGPTVIPTRNGAGDYTFVFTYDVSSYTFFITPSSNANVNCVGFVDEGFDPSGKTFDVLCFTADNGVAAESYFNVQVF